MKKTLLKSFQYKVPKERGGEKRDVNYQGEERCSSFANCGTH